MENSIVSSPQSQGQLPRLGGTRPPEASQAYLGKGLNRIDVKLYRAKSQHKSFPATCHIPLTATCHMPHCSIHISYSVLVRVRVWENSGIWHLASGNSVCHIRKSDIGLGAVCSRVCLFPLSLSSLLSHTREETVSVWSTIFSLTRSVTVTGRRSLYRK